MEKPGRDSVENVQALQTGWRRFLQPPIPPFGEKKPKTAAAIAFFLGGFGLHGFYLGSNQMGFILLVLHIVSVGISLFPALIVLVFGQEALTLNALLLISGIGLAFFLGLSLLQIVQAFRYLRADEPTFYQKYVVERRWF